jgi:adhesin HecA-like repeat protein
VINSPGWGQSGGDVTCGNTLQCGTVAPGDYSISGGQACFVDLYVGYSDMGTMTMAGGIVNVSSRLIVGHLGLDVASVIATGAVWITGGQLTMTNSYSIIGNSGVGQMSISNGTVTAADVIVANSSNPGTLTLAGGTLTVNSLVLTNPSSRFNFSGGCLNANAIIHSNGQTCVTGDGVTPSTVNLLGGSASLANGLTISANATLSGVGVISSDVVNLGLICPGSGALTISGVVTNYGTIVATNGCTINFNGQVVNNGLIITNSAMHFNAGLINNSTLLDPAGDADGDGMNNLWEALAGTNPTNSASLFRVTAVTRVGNDVLVNWSAVGGKRYVVQATTGTGGNYSTNFVDISPAISVPGTGESRASYTDSGAAISNPARFYRVRLAP